MKKISFVLNLPYTFLGFLTAFLSLPRTIAINRSPFAVVIKVKKLHQVIWWKKGIRGITIGNMILLGNIDGKTFEHELVHIKQFEKYPIIFPILYVLELIKNGYRNNKYEIEAYRVAGNI